MRSKDDVLAGTRWDEAEVPVRLRDLLSDDPAVRETALSYLADEILDEGTPYDDTPHAAEYVAAILGDERSHPARARLIAWLGRVADAAVRYRDPMYFPGSEECAEMRPGLYAAVLPFADDPDPAVRRAVSDTTRSLLVDHRLGTEARLAATRLLRDVRGGPLGDRVAAADTLIRWGLAPVELLGDEHPAVRAHAATAPELNDDPTAQAEVRSALRRLLAGPEQLGIRTPPDPLGRYLDPDAPDSEPVESPYEPYPLDRRGQEDLRDRLVRTLLNRTTTLDEIAEEAVAVARSVRLPSYVLVPLLERAFPGGYAAGQPLTAGQRRMLAAHAGNDDCWADGVCTQLGKVGLPQDRADAVHLTSPAEG